MRIDRQEMAFTAAATGATLADINLQGAEAFAVLLEITSHAGTATNTHPDVVPRIGTLVGTSAGVDALGSADLTNQTGLFPLMRVGAAGAAKTTFLPSGWYMANALVEARVRITLGGAAHTITGKVHILRVMR